MNIIPQGTAVCIAGKSKICCFIARQNDDFYSRAYHEAEAVRVLAAASASFGYTEEPLVSSDIIGITYGSLFDATQTMVKYMPETDTTQVQVVSWYDNENSYTSQMVRTIKYFSEI